MCGTPVLIAIIFFLYTVWMFYFYTLISRYEYIGP